MPNPQYSLNCSLRILNCNLQYWLKRKFYLFPNIALKWQQWVEYSRPNWYGICEGWWLSLGLESVTVRHLKPCLVHHWPFNSMLQGNNAYHLEDTYLIYKCCGQQTLQIKQTQGTCVYKAKFVYDLQISGETNYLDLITSCLIRLWSCFSSFSQFHLGDYSN